MKEIHKPRMSASMVMVTDANGNPSTSSLITVNELNTLNNYDGKGYVFPRLGALETGLVGEIKWYAGKSAPAGYLVCDGATVSRTTYAKLYAAIGTTWGAGDGSSTFKLPNLIDRVAWGATAASGYIEAGLPNITGGISDVYGGYGSCNGSGVFQSTDGNTHTRGGGGGDSPNKNVTFDASRSNSIYGKSNTVQPPAAKLMPIIKY